MATTCLPPYITIREIVAKQNNVIVRTKVLVPILTTQIIADLKSALLPKQLAKTLEE